MQESGVARVTVALDPVDVELLDRLAKLEGSNRSAELRGILAQMRPVIRATVEAFEAALRARDQLDQAAAQATVTELEAIMPDVQRLQNVYLGAVARLEGEAAAAEQNPRPSNHGGHTSSTEHGSETESGESTGPEDDS